MKQDHRILKDLVNSWEECSFRDCIVGWTVSFKKVLPSLLALVDAGYIKKTSAHNHYWSIYPTESGIAFANSLTNPKADWLYTIANLN